MRVRIVGVGTRRGDDAAGLATAERLAAAPLPGGVEVCACERPAPDLLDALAGAEIAVIVDAMHSGSAPGSVRRVPAAELDRAAPCSTHALGVGAALALAAALGRAPRRVELVGIEAAPGEARDAGPAGAAALSEPVQRGVARAAELVRALLEELTGARDGRDAATHA